MNAPIYDLRCPACNNDLSVENGVTIESIDYGKGEFYLGSRLAPDGALRDRHHVLRLGRLGRTLCGECVTVLVPLSGVVT